MTDRDSPIADFYPREFEVDMDGKRYAWQGVPLLPFVDGERLVEAVAEKYDSLTTEEAARNEPGRVLLFLSKSKPLFNDVRSFFKSASLSSKVGVGRLWLR